MQSPAAYPGGLADASGQFDAIYDATVTSASPDDAILLLPNLSSSVSSDLILA